MDYKEFDFEGEETLKAMSHANRLNLWMYSQMKPFIKGKSLEIGSGIGNISKCFIDDGNEIDLSDIRDQYTDYLKVTFPSNSVLNVNIVHPDFDIIYKALLGTYDLVYALNVVEHIENDILALANMKKLLKPGGYIYILVPAYSFLYNNFDKALFHFRRYNKAHLKSIFPIELNIKKSWYFNFAGIFGWYIVGNILKKEIIPESNMKLYNSLTPIFQFVDFVLCRKIGLSVVVVAQNK
jgi:2-polyprenyl-3-methyl-5-hydroxy-6-metoxy-1,4-benzoquinol methylase